MDTSVDEPRPAKLDQEPSFRKLSSDAANRRYRRRSLTGSDSSSSGGSPIHKRSRSPLHGKEVRSKIPEDWQKKADGREIGSEMSHNRSIGGHKSQRDSDRHLYVDSRESRRHDDYKRYHSRHADDYEERHHSRSSRSGRESRPDAYSDHIRCDGLYDRFGDRRNIRSRGKSDGWDQKSNGKNREALDWDRKKRGALDLDHYRHNEREHEKSLNERKILYSARDHGNNREHDRHRDYEEVRGYWKDMQKTKSKEISEQEDFQKRKQKDKVNEPKADRYSDMSDREHSSADKDKPTHRESGNAAVDKPSSSSKLAVETLKGAKSESMISIVDQDGSSNNDLNAAKVAAIKAAESVNRNIVGFGGAASFGFISNEQKKKLLWGNKKNSAAEENRWDLNLFADQERQEKFNKLMGVKGGGTAPESSRPEAKDGDLQAKKREELNIDLEKQYTAGLRRRDGRTVGLGL